MRDASPQASVKEIAGSEECAGGWQPERRHVSEIWSVAAAPVFLR